MTAAEAVKKALKTTKYKVTPVNSKKVNISIPQGYDFEKTKQEISMIVQPLKSELGLSELTVTFEQLNKAEITIK
jgi:hypothetical protein